MVTEMLVMVTNGRTRLSEGSTNGCPGGAGPWLAGIWFPRLDPGQDLALPQPERPDLALFQPKRLHYGVGGGRWFGVFLVVLQSSFAFEEENDKKEKEKKKKKERSTWYYHVRV
jgi:hypothetical protein